MSDERRNVTDEFLKTTLQLDAETQLRLILETIAPTVRALHAKAKAQRILDVEDVEILSKLSAMLVRLKTHTNDEDLSSLSDEELAKRAKKK